MLPPDRPRPVRRFLEHVHLSVRVHGYMLYSYILAVLAPFIPGFKPARVHDIHAVADTLLCLMILNAGIVLYLHHTKEPQ